MHGNSRYQVAGLDPQGSGLRAALEGALERRMRELGLESRQCLRFLHAHEVEDRSTKEPVVGIYRGGPLQDDTCTRALASLREAGADILPLVDDLATYPQSVPEVLRPINGMVR